MDQADMARALVCPLYLIGALIAARIAFIRDTARGETASRDRYDRAISAMLVGSTWPIIVALGLIALPIMAVAWVVSRPTQAERQAVIDQTKDME